MLSLKHVWERTGHFVAHQCHLNFYRVHLTYFVIVTLLASAIFHGSSTKGYHVTYIDSLFLTTSAICGVGLNTINLGVVNSFQQSILFVLMLMGDLTLITQSVVWIRRYYFTQKLKDLLSSSVTAGRIAADVEESAGHPDLRRRISALSSLSAKHTNGDRDKEDTQSLLDHVRSLNALLSGSNTKGYGGFEYPWTTGLRWFSQQRAPRQELRNSPQSHSYLTFPPALDNRGRFRNLTSAQERELGGVEYRALVLLTWLLPCYALFWIALVLVVLVPYSDHSSVAGIVRNAQPGNLNPIWWSVFNSISGYTNTGLTLLNDNMIPLRHNYAVIIFTGMVVIVGNSMYPVLLRLTIWLLSKIVSKQSRMHHSCMFLLHHPRRCYLFLFPAKATWILFAVQTGITLSAWVFWIILQIDYGPITHNLPPGQREMDGLFQSVGLRASGFYIITIDSIAPALQIFYLIVMYISVFPVLLSVRSTNVYEERSLGQSNSSPNTDGRKGQNDSQPGSDLGRHIQKQLGYDLWWLLLALFLITIIERNSLAAPAPGWSLFSVIFEVVSAYGTVGFSLGVPYNDYSFCGSWRILSKLILVTVMLRGRHRILPMAIDRAVLLPGEELMVRLDRDYNHTDEKSFERCEEEVRRLAEGEQVEERNGEGVAREQDPSNETGAE